jgi:hypothetical protein
LKQEDFWAAVRNGRLRSDDESLPAGDRAVIQRAEWQIEDAQIKREQEIAAEELRKNPPDQKLRSLEADAERAIAKAAPAVRALTEYKAAQAAKGK